jgi:hypothetical protein
VISHCTRFLRETGKKEQAEFCVVLSGIVGKQADLYRQKAKDCERAASGVTDENVRTAYLEMADRWRRMATQREAIERVILSSPQGQ